MAIVINTWYENNPYKYIWITSSGAAGHVDVVKNGESWGTVSAGEKALIECDENDSIELTAVPDGGNSFDNWHNGGGIISTEEEIEVTMNGDKARFANFSGM